MRIRVCEEADIPAVTAIYREAVLHGRASFEIEPPDGAEMRRRRSAILDGGYPYIVAEIAGGIGGYAYAGPYRSRRAYRNTVENSVYVDAAARGRGIGAGLLNELIAEVERRGFRQMIAVIGDSANVPSVRLHEACGFTHVGVLRSIGWKHEAWLDTVLMQRALGPGDGAPADPESR